MWRLVSFSLQSSATRFFGRRHFRTHTSSISVLFSSSAKVLNHSLFPVSFPVF
ncbi:hypothetical protein LEP1GSC038_0228 [Leptospira weilii str. 2006001855]|uniref:Uncharacterized protein n=1 Tax=Leptospira weilii str. 2006001855 TaxID=996804 RepID=M6FSQ1_9LEPT|nr:hypothetical protein LEP1GSC038_0228 [Leptospira weilii str. 2006001855]